MRPAHANLSVVALRRPQTGCWMAFVAKVLLFGSISEVLHYNSSSCCLSIFLNKCLGIPTVSYLDDFGPFIPTELSQAALETFAGPLSELASGLNDDKSGLVPELKFL